MDKNHNKAIQANKTKALLSKFNRQDLRARGIDGLLSIIFEIEKDVKELCRERLALEKENAQQKEIIAQLTDAQLPKSKYQRYDKTKPWVFKVCFILERNPNGMSFTEIKQEIMNLEPDLRHRWSDTDNYLSQILRAAVKRGAIIKEKLLRVRGFNYKLQREAT